MCLRETFSVADYNTLLYASRQVICPNIILTQFLLMADSSSNETLPMAADARSPENTTNPFAGFDNLQPPSSTPAYPSPSRRVTRALSRDPSPCKRLMTEKSAHPGTDNSETRRMMTLQPNLGRDLRMIQQVLVYYARIEYDIFIFFE